MRTVPIFTSAKMGLSLLPPKLTGRVSSGLRIGLQRSRAVSDLVSPPFCRLFDRLERDQEAFLAQESRFRSPGYRWPRKPLHNWSRAWEYPYVFHALESWRCALGQEGGKDCQGDGPIFAETKIGTIPDAKIGTVPTLPLVADVGSGATFFSFSVARLGCRVVCTDVDAFAGDDLRRASEVLPQRPSRSSSA